MLTRKPRSAEKGASSQWVILAPVSVTDLPKKSGCGPLFTRLRNPSTGQAALYLFSSDAHQLFEIKAFHEEYRSWFIGQTVQHDGRLFFATPVDPLFLVLFYCIQAQKEVDQTVKVLKDQDVCVGGKVQSATFISGKQITDATEVDYILYAHGLISEYIPEELSTALAKYLRLPQVTSPPAEPAPKKRKLSDAPVEAEEDYTKFNTGDLKNKKASNKMSAAQKALAKVDKSGMKTISAFFNSKTKVTK
ncbi:ribonuclease H2 subunit B isoform X5 [Hemicordylus capensis]|uniref:ribonuclease H2 subunit B isoform X5 n=1 Tax=Hemicordylus capensis TaxID=884348 RepID=UPI002302E115|nr:ribonuclease H2 subunit B isoform X5 [Hemicordylus capensis]